MPPSRSRCSCGRIPESDVGALLSLADDFGLSVTTAGGVGLAGHVRGLRRHGRSVVLSDVGVFGGGPRSATARRPEGLAADLVRNGLRPALGSGTGRATRFLRLLAARHVAHGLDRGDALRAVTSWAAAAVGAEKELGTLQQGRRGDVVVWDGDPFAPETRVVRVFVAGREVYRAAP